jgi:hypothetical protein
MKTHEFISTLKTNPGKTLYFEYRSGAFVRSDYHITEIKNVSYDTVDCGGIQNTWQEVHIQLWENSLPEPEHEVNTTKALKIFEVVEKTRPTAQDVEIKFEYGNSSYPTAVLPVFEIVDAGNALIVKLTSDQTTCKAKDRATTPEEKAAACCGPVTKPKLRISDLNQQASCTPESGCC